MVSIVRQKYIKTVKEGKHSDRDRHIENAAEYLYTNYRQLSNAKYKRGKIIDQKWKRDEMMIDYLFLFCLW